MKKILQFWIDYDGCFYSDNIKFTESETRKIKGRQKLVAKPSTPISFDGPIIKHMERAIYSLRPDLVEICTFSNRQDIKTDNKNCMSHGSLSSFEVYSALTIHFQKRFPDLNITNDRFLLADTYRKTYKAGYTWNKALKILSRRKNGLPFEDAEGKAAAGDLWESVVAHDRKADLFYCKAHHACNTHPDSLVHAVVYDDREDILALLYNFYKRNSQLLPRLFSADLFAFTSINGFNSEREQHDKEIYLRQSPLKFASDDVTLTQKTQILPGVENRQPEPFPYVSINNKLFFNKGSLVRHHFMDGQPINMDESKTLIVSQSYNAQNHRIGGTGCFLKPNGHLLSNQLNGEFRRRIAGDPGMSDIWTKVDMEEPGLKSGAWGTPDTILSIICGLTQTSEGRGDIFIPVEYYTRACWLELSYYKYPRLKLPYSDPVDAISLGKAPVTPGRQSFLGRTLSFRDKS